LDDDSVFTDRSTVQSVLQYFADPRVAAVAMPFVNVARSPTVLQLGDADTLLATDRYVGTAHAIRRADFELVGGYRESFVHIGEEADLCLRLLSARRLTVLATTPPVHHFESAVRDRDRMMHFARQNEVLFALWNVPWPYILPHLVYTTLHGLIIGFHHHSSRRAMSGVVAGYRVAFKSQDQRRPVDIVTYRLHRRLRKRGPMSVSDLFAARGGVRH
jgi:GT2 family glycosyltransferase